MCNRLGATVVLDSHYNVDLREPFEERLNSRGRVLGTRDTGSRRHRLLVGDANTPDEDGFS